MWLHTEYFCFWLTWLHTEVKKIVSGNNVFHIISLQKQCIRRIAQTIRYRDESFDTYGMLNGGKIFSLGDSRTVSGGTNCAHVCNKSISIDKKEGRMPSTV